MREPCGKCGTWVCDACGWKRSGASRKYPDHDCARCGGIEGTFRDFTHRNPLNCPGLSDTELDGIYAAMNETEGA